MPRRSPPTLPPDLRDSEIRQLRDELYLARCALVQSVRPQARIWLEAHTDVRSFEDLDRWMSWAVDGLLTVASVDAPSAGFGTQRRAVCPLCGESAQSPYTSGFALPTGLTRHLVGSHGSRMCTVFNAAFAQARDSAIQHRDGRGLRWEDLGDPPKPPWEVQEAGKAHTANVVKLRPD